MNASSCPECGERIYRDDFQCASCGLLLHPEQASGEYVLTDPSIVRAMLAPDQPRSDTEEFYVPEFLDAGPPQDQRVTSVSALPISEDVCPQLVSGLDALTPLQPFEAHVAAYIDGETTVEGLSRASHVSVPEVRAVIASLLARGVVELEAPKAKAKRSKSKPNVAAVTPPAPPIEDVPTRRRPRDGKPQPPPKAPPRPLGSFSAALDQVAGPVERQEQRSRMGLYGRSAVEKALDEARARRNNPLPESAAVLLDSPDEFLQRAIALERQGQVDGAIYVLKRSIERVRQPGPLYNKLALILLNQRKDYRQAEELLRRAVKSEPNNTVYQANLYKVLALAAEEPSVKRDADGLWSRLRGK